jgi:hypothetical protein
MAKINELIIRIFEGTDEPGYFYDIYDTVDMTDDDAQSIDGGFCTTTIENALDMAVSQAKNIIRNGMDYKEAKEKLVNEDDDTWSKNCNRHMWDDWERQIREDERTKVLQSDDLSQVIIKELGFDKTIELMKRLSETIN